MQPRSRIFTQRPFRDRFRKVSLAIAGFLVSFVAFGALVSNDPRLRSTARDVPGEASIEVERATDRAEWTGRVAAVLARREYEASESRVGLQAPNRAQRLRTVFGADSISVVDRTATGNPGLVDLAVRSYGRGDARIALPPGDVSHAGQRVEVARSGQGFVEWYENTPAGLEQGFTLAARPAGDGPLDVELSVRRASVIAGDDGLLFQSDVGRTLRYSKLHVTDAEGVKLASHFDLTNDGFRIVVDDAKAEYPILIDPLLTGEIDAELESNQTGSRFGRGLAPAGDVNGDGYADVIVGAYLFDLSGLPDAGAAFVFHGGPAGVGDGNPINADGVLFSDQANSGFGFAVAAAGDVNGDGYDDVVVGAYRYEGFGGPVDEGAAWIFHGGPNGISQSGPADADTILRGDQASSRFGIAVNSAGDVNGDGYADVLVGADFYDLGQANEGVVAAFLGSASGIANATPASAHALFESDQIGARLGLSVDSAGDIDADGFDDIVISALQFDVSLFGSPTLDAGLVGVFYGSAVGLSDSSLASADTILTSFSAGARFGSDVSAAGDVNGDGYGDIVVGSYLDLTPQGNASGVAYVYEGSASGLSATAAAEIFGSGIDGKLGWSVDGGGDLDGDGYSDIVLGAYDDFGYGLSYAYRGSSTGIPSGEALLSAYRTISPGAQSGSRFGVEVAFLGDVDGDGITDLAISADLHNGPQIDEGSVFIWHGSSLGMIYSSPPVIESNQEDSRMGYDVSSAGDINGDGYDDVVVGARFYDAGETDEGAAFVFLGGPDGITGIDPGTAHAQLESDQAIALFGAPATSAGDINGDGYGDLLVAAGRYDAGELDEGAVFLFLGGPQGIADADPGTAHARIESNQIAGELGNSAGAAGDVNGDGYSDIIVGSNVYDSGEQSEGAAFIFHGGPAGLSDSGVDDADTRLESNQMDAGFAWDVASAGDVNGDGFSDIVVGANQFTDGQNREGAAFVFLGSALGVPSGDLTVAQAQIEANQAYAYLGYSVASAGDVNADGYSDVILGTPFYFGGAGSVGAALVFLGSPAGIIGNDPLTAHAHLESNQASSSFGVSVSSAGDVNGDGFSDVVIGDISYNSAAGAAYVYLGGPLGIPNDGMTQNPVRLTIGGTGSRSGFSVASAGDVNGDGYSDVIVGGPYYDGGGTSEGGAVVHHGLGFSESRLAAHPRQLRGDGSGAVVAPGGLSHSPGSFVVEMQVASPLGRERARLEVEVCPPGVAFGLPGCVVDVSPTWVDLGTTGASFSEEIDGLSEDTAYRWRARPQFIDFNAIEPGIDPVIRYGQWTRKMTTTGTADIRVPEPSGVAPLALAVLALLGVGRRRVH